MNRRSLGAWLWVLNVQYFIVQLLVAADWASINSYSWANNTISDLGNSHCGQYGVRLVCSPLHMVMNGSFIMLGIMMAGGAWLLSRALAPTRITKCGLGCFALGGIGTVLVGIFPENTIAGLHVAGAALPFVLGNVGLLLLGVCLKSAPRSLRVYTVFSGALGLVALMLFLSGNHFGIGGGGMERVTAYPQTIWMIVFGGYLLASAQAIKQPS